MGVENNKVKEIFAMDGVTVLFSVTNMRVIEATDIKASRYDTVDLTTTELTNGVDFTVVLTDDNNIAVTVTDAGDSDDELTIYREMTNLQESDYTDYGSFPAETVETDLDRRTLIAQQVQESSDRALRLPITVSGVSTDLPVPTALFFLRWNAAGDAIEGVAEITSTDYSGALEQGLVANIPASGNAGDVYFATDTSHLYIHDGSNYVIAGANGLHFTNLANVPSAAGKIPVANAPVEMEGSALSVSTGAVATDASDGNYFEVDCDDDFTLSNPTNGTDKQKITWKLRQDGTGSRLITLDTKFKLGTDIAAVTLSTAADTSDFLSAIYDSSEDLWHVVSFVTGYATT